MSHKGTPSRPSSPTLPNVAVNEPPPLPKIRSEQLRQRIFTHSSLSGGHRHPFQAPDGTASADNEELFHIGDQVFALAITDLIQDLYPQLRVGPASKLRDDMKRRCVLAEICVSYGLHERLRVNLPESQARNLRDSPNVQVDVFKAYVGGVYRDQGLEVVSRWLSPLFRSRVEAAYQNLRKHHLLPPEFAASPQPAASTTHYRSPSAGPPLPSYLVENLVDTRPEGNDPPNRKRGRLSSPGKDGSGNAEGSWSRRRSSTDLNTTEGARKRTRSKGPDGF